MGILDQWKKDRERRKQIGEKAKVKARETYWKEYEKARVSQARKRARKRAVAQASPRDFGALASGFGKWMQQREINPAWAKNVLGVDYKPKPKKKKKSKTKTIVIKLK